MCSVRRARSLRFKCKRRIGFTDAPFTFDAGAARCHAGLASHQDLAVATAPEGEDSIMLAEGASSM